jgi:hypothetical protein
VAVIGHARLKPRLGLPAEAALPVHGQRRAASSLAPSRGRPFHQIHLIVAVQLFDQHLDPFARARFDFLTDHVGLNRELAAAAVDEDAQ